MDSHLKQSPIQIYGNMKRIHEGTDVVNISNMKHP